MARGVVIGGLNSGGSNIKSIQRGVLTTSYGGTYNVPISSVDRTKSIILYSFTSSDNNSQPSVDFTSDSNVKIVAPGSTMLIIAWQVIEFNNVKSIQRGTITVGNNITSQNVYITAVNRSKAILITNVFSGNQSYPSFVSGELNTDNLIIFQKNYYTGVDIYWHVIEFN